MDLLMYNFIVTITDEKRTSLIIMIICFKNPSTQPIAIIKVSNSYKIIFEIFLFGYQPIHFFVEKQENFPMADNVSHLMFLFILNI